MTHPIPVDALEASHLLVVGTTGSGKTYLARGLLEQLRRAGRRVGAIDKLGKLWGLTLSADGAGPGLEFVICGGKRPGAVPMRPDDGAKLGRLFVERNLPAIFDLSQWTAPAQEEWVAAFGDAVFQHNEGALHLAIDEAQSFVPLNGGGPAFNSIRRLAEQGRGNGVNLLLTAPRLSRVDATVRGAMQGIVAMRQTGTNDRAATAELLSGEAAVDEKSLKAELPGLPTGTGYVGIPGARQLESIAFPPNSTFDSSRTPRHGDKPPAPIAVSSALVDEPSPQDGGPGDPEEADRRGSEVGGRLAERDRRIAELEERLGAAVRRSDIAETIIDQLLDGISAAVDALDRVREAIVDESEMPSAGAGEDMTAATSASGTANSHDRLPCWSARAAAAIAAGLSKSSSTFSLNRRAMLDGEWIVVDADGIVSFGPSAIADAGVAAAIEQPIGDPVAFWASKFTPGVGRMLLFVAEKWRRSRRAVGRAEIAEGAGMSLTSSTFAGGLTELRRNGLIETQGAGFVLAKALRDG